MVVEYRLVDQTFKVVFRKKLVAKRNIRIAVVGSVNYDITSYMDAFPRPNETLFATDYKTAIGGKGLNQAVAAARYGADVSMIGCVGDDGFGAQAITHLEANGVACSAVHKTVETGTGFAAIFVNKAGDNMISVAPGANAALSVEHVNLAKAVIENADMVITQAEVSAEVIARALEIAAIANVPTVLNPAPANSAFTPLLGNAHYITPNESETEILTGISPDDPESTASALAGLREKGARNILITLGSRGCLVSWGDRTSTVASFKVDVVDTTGAGDVFNGVFAATIAEGQDMERAARTANAAAALSVTKLTADSAPDRKDIDSFLTAAGNA